MKNILIPTDFSENAWKAIDYALNFFKGTPCNFYLLHVTKVMNYAGGETPIIPTSVTIENTLLEQCKVDLEKSLVKIKKKYHNTKHHFITIPSYDYFIDAIRNQVDEKEIDLIVMGTKGASGIKEVIIGSNTGDVITKVKSMVLAVPDKTVYNSPKEIVFPTDFNTFYQTDILNSIAEFAALHDSTIRILHVAKKDEELRKFQKENKDYLNDYFADIKHSFHRVTNKKIETGVQCFVESREIDMIIMVAKNLNLFQQIIFKPTVEEISYHTNVPFLVIHE
jgi:nucleotide-binding universal stress UspA family protein